MRNRRAKDDQLPLRWTATMEWPDVPPDIRAQATELLGMLLRAVATVSEPQRGCGGADADA